MEVEAFEVRLRRKLAVRRWNARSGRDEQLVRYDHDRMGKVQRRERWEAGMATISWQRARW